MRCNVGNLDTNSTFNLGPRYTTENVHLVGLEPFFSTIFKNSVPV